MPMETLSGKQLSKIGIGSWGVGGRGHRDMEITEKQNDEVYEDALVYALQHGINFTEIALGYGHGQSLALFKRAFDRSSIDRRDIFLTHSLYPRDLPTIEVMFQDIDGFYQTMGTDYADSTLITQSLILKFGEGTVYPILHQLLENGKTRFVSLSNASPNGIKAFKQEFGDNFFAHEGHLSFEVRALQDKGVFQTCDDLGVANIIWRPLRRNKTMGHDWELLKELAEKYGKTQGQIILNWMCSLGYRPMVMSTNQNHIDENLASKDFVMSDEDYQKMTDFRPTNYNPPVVHWDSLEVDDDIVRLVNEFEGHEG
jgi:2,5-diketo-D-gluconate reductase A